MSASRLGAHSLRAFFAVVSMASPSVAEVTFGAPSPATLGLFPKFVEGDVDGDSDDDLAVHDQGEVYVLINEDGGFAKQPIATFTDPVWDIGFIRGDAGRLDLLIAVGEDTLIAQNLGGGAFSTPPVATLPGEGSRMFCVANINGDEFDDLVSFNEIGGSYSYSVRPGTAGVSFGAPTYSQPWLFPPIKFLCEDFDDDGLDEILALDSTGLSWRENSGGNVTGPILPAGFPVPIHDISAAQFTEDECLDLIRSHDISPPVAVFTGIDVSFGECDALPFTFNFPDTGGGGPAWRSIGADLDGDGDTDLVGVKLDSPTLFWLENDGANEFGPEKIIATLPLSVNAPLPSRIRTANLDGNAAPDLVVDYGGAIYTILNTTAKSRNRRRPGSLLVFPVHRSDAGMFTVLSVTNTHLGPATPSGLGGTTNVQFEYVNVLPSASNPLLPLDCYITDRVETLTPADTSSVLTRCHNAANAVGYAVATAQDPTQFKTAWSHNYLVGSELVLNASAGAFALNAVAFRTDLAPGLPTDIAPADGRANLNDIEYHQPPGGLILDSFLALTNSHLVLVDLSGVPGGVNTIRADVWNDDELPFSATFQFRCWFDLPLGLVSPVFSPQFLAGLPNDPAELDIDCDGTGDLESGWASLRSTNLSSSSASLPGAPFLGAITGGPGSIYGGRLLWEVTEAQTPGVATVY